jgi:hypothetical protein
VKLKTSAGRLLVFLLTSVNSSAVFGNSPSVLKRGDEAVLAPPVANFRLELERIRIAPPPFQAVNTTYSPIETNLAIEIQDLRSALTNSDKSAAEVDRISTNYLAERSKLEAFKQVAGNWNEDTSTDVNNRPPFPKVDFAEGLPDEFADYLEGTMNWINPTMSDKSFARQAWERILSLPQDERRFKSTWAAYMLGRSWEKEDPDKAIEFYRKTRTLAQEGFADSLGLAVGSLGREARLQLNRNNYAPAIELYLQQFAAGDESAYNSLCFTIRSLIRGEPDALPSLFKDPQTRRVVTAYIISTKALRTSVEYIWDVSPESSNHLFEIVSTWLSTAEQSGNDDPEMAEEFALAAYQNHQWATAQRWIDRAPGSATAQWLRAKLLLRDRKVAQAESLLTKLAVAFPLDSSKSETHGDAIELKDELTVPPPDGVWSELDAPEEIRAELGIIHLAHGQYAEALDDLLGAGLWMDAAYLAERILSVDELKNYVDRKWPSLAMDQNALGVDFGGEGSRSWFSEQIRYLLARRLLRVIRGNEAREYYPSEWQPLFDELSQALLTGWNESLPAEQRANALFTAAGIMRTNGMELAGTEVGPDWHLCGGDCTGTLSGRLRTGATFTLFPATADELRREEQHKPDPNVRFHYRYQAAFLGWEAAKLMPDNSDETARVLWTSGVWLKDRDAQTANLFYKSLVRRCRYTSIGEAADRIRWFPFLNDEGEDGPEDPLAESEELRQLSDGDEPEMADQIDPGNEIGTEEQNVYVVQPGDSLNAIVQALHFVGESVTIQDIVDANGLESDRLEVGQKIVIPLPDSEGTDE